MQDLEFRIELDKKGVTCALDRSEEVDESVCFVIGHGASGDLKSGNLPAIAKSLAGAGISVLRYNAGGQLKSRVKVLEALLNSNHTELSGVRKWILAGHSMGGRSACAVARSRDDVIAVVLFSYPLHPPGKPEELRDVDLVTLEMPVLFVKGTKDTFSTEEPWQEVLSRMQSPQVEVVTVEKGDHSLSTKSGIGKQRYEEWMSKVIEFSHGLAALEQSKGSNACGQQAKTEAETSGQQIAKPDEKASKSKRRRTK